MTSLPPPSMYTQDIVCPSCSATTRVNVIAKDGTAETPCQHCKKTIVVKTGKDTAFRSISIAGAPAGCGLLAFSIVLTIGFGLLSFPLRLVRIKTVLSLLEKQLPLGLERAGFRVGCVAGHWQLPFGSWVARNVGESDPACLHGTSRIFPGPSSR